MYAMIRGRDGGYRHRPNLEYPKDVKPHMPGPSITALEPFV